MHNPRRTKLRRSPLQWHPLSPINVPIFLAAALILGCHTKVQPDAQQAFDSIHRLFVQGNVAEAHRQAEQDLKRFAPQSPEWDTRFRLLEAEIWTQEGGHSQQILALLQSVPAGAANPDFTIERQMLRSLAHAHLGDQKQSSEEIQEALELANATHSKLLGDVLRSQGRLQAMHDDLSGAEDSSNQSLAFARVHNDRFLEASDLANLGSLARINQHYDEALDLFKSAAQAARAIDARSLLELTLGAAGVAYYKLGDFERALVDFREAAAQAKSLGLSAYEVTWLNEEGMCLYQLGDTEGAEAAYRASLKIAQALDDQERTGYTTTQLAFLLYARGQFEQADAYSHKALQIARAVGSQSTEAEPLFLQALLLAQQKGKQKEAAIRLEQLDRKADTDPSLQWRIQNSLAKLYEKLGDARTAQRWYQASIATFEAERSSLKQDESRLPFFGNGNALYSDYASFLITNHKSSQALQLIDLGRARTLEESLEGQGTREHPSQDVEPQSIARRLNATILFYSLGPKKSFLWAVTSRHTQFFELPPEQEIERHVRDYQKMILRSSDPLERNNPDALYLYDKLVAPAQALLPPGSKVFVIPDGCLNGLSFEALLTKGPTGKLHYWLEDAMVSTAPSLRLLASFQPASPPPQTRLLLIGNTVSPGSEYPSLQNSAEEMADIERHFPGTNNVALSGAAAIPASYLESKPEEFTYIHFSTHGTASELSPLDSAVILSPPPAQPGSFKLYARDILRRPLQADLVTVSACNGSGTRVFAGEGIVGLSWAFLRAGAHNVIGTLWEVSDRSTPVLMDHMYAELSEGATPDAALRDAKLSLVHSTGVFRKPLYWAAFQLYAGGFRPTPN